MNRPITHGTNINTRLIIVNGDCAASIAHCKLRAVGSLHVGLVDKCADSVTDHRITFHLTHSQAALCSTTTRRLVRPLLSASLPSGVPLVLRHVLQSHRIDITHENGRGDHDTRCAIIEELLAHRLHTKLLLENLSNGRRRRSLVHESCRISNGTCQSRRLS